MDDRESSERPPTLRQYAAQEAVEALIARLESTESERDRAREQRDAMLDVIQEAYDQLAINFPERAFDVLGLAIRDAAKAAEKGGA